MLGKLIKHEFLVDGKFFGPSYLVMLVLALLGRLPTWLSTRQNISASASFGAAKVLQGLASFISLLYGIAFVALLFMTIIFLVNRFSKNFFTDEGYLMLTLPTHPRDLVFSKLLNYFIWVFFSSVVSIGSLWISMSSSEQFNRSLSRFWDTLTDSTGFLGQEIHAQIGVPGWGFALELFFAYLVWSVQFVLICYFSIAFGQLRAKNHKVLGGVLSFLVFTILFQVIISLYAKLANNFTVWFHGGAVVQAVIWFLVLLLAIIAALEYWATCRIMSRNVNLD